MPVTHDSNCDSIQSPSDIVAGISKPCNCQRSPTMSDPQNEQPNDEIRGNLAPLGVNALADRIRAAIGAGPFEPVSVYAPPHRSRMDGKEAAPAPISRPEFEALRSLPREKLIELGLRPWDDDGLLLFPVEWYNAIPDGFEIACTDGTQEPFVHGTTDDDCRFGVLAFGIIPR